MVCFSQGSIGLSFDIFVAQRRRIFNFEGGDLKLPDQEGAGAAFLEWKGLQVAPDLSSACSLGPTTTASQICWPYGFAPLGSL